ncbi:protein of unknown function [Tistlia consotensis]|uniref:DUF3576 domain-containing protein n=1 Tax=Tistlia consotensis USBA 355 TaxID=560819 RepID=A0A1Y6CNM5_9PROT|nr:DUF3576 domain-containing protein [Tistlia consotensis]SMF77756.1 protein of unknown function [Tistlia consotensis USBA 355]SNS20657.1 protein of unknown function [Tistlia consotensis]
MMSHHSESSGRRKSLPWQGLAALLLAAGLAACSSADPNTAYPHSRPHRRGATYEQSDRPPGADGLALSGLLGKGGSEGAEKGVDGFLWQASLDSLSSLPLASADPAGGVIITEWYAAPDQPDVRRKVDVVLQGGDLDGAAVRVSVFRQVREAGGAWKSVPAAQNADRELETAILAKARQLRDARRG